MPLHNLLESKEMRSDSLWRTLPLGARAISSLPIVTFIITSMIFLSSYLGASNRYRDYFLIGFLLWISLASLFIANLVLGSTEKRPAGFLDIPPISLIAFNILNLCMVLFWIVHVLTNLRLLFFWEGMLVCNILTRTSVTAWGLSFALGNLLLYVAYAEFRVLTGKLGVLARRVSLLNGIISFAVFIFSVYVSITGILCAGAVG